MPDSPNNSPSPDRATVSTEADSASRLPRKLKISLPGYKLGKVIARGGQAIVIKAVQKSSGKDVAVKLLREGPLADDAARSRLQREVAVLAALKHPNIISVIDHGLTPEGLDYIVMDFVTGKPLYELIQAQSDPLESCPPLSDFLKIFTKICAAMHSAHLHGIVHRDLCPSNILIDAQADPHILDFGLARTAFDQYIGGGPSKSSTGQFIGKPQYASPEQARGEPEKIDIRTDVYALGIILYQILTGGEFPYSVTGNFVEVLGNIVNEPPTPPSKLIGSREIQKRNPGEALAGTRRPAGVTRVLEAIVMKAIEKDPQNRYQSAGELGHDIENYLTGKPTIAHRESARFDAPALSPEFTQWRIVLAGAAIVTICVWAIFHFANVLPDFGGSSEDIQPSDAAKVAARLPGPPIAPPPPHGSPALSAGPPINFGLRLGPAVAVPSPTQVVVSHPPPPSGPPIGAEGSEDSNLSKLKTPDPQIYGPPMGVPLSPPQTNQAIDLLGILQADILKGKWTRTHDGIESNAASSVLKLRYVLKGEYDFAVTFTCKPGNDIEPRDRRGVCQILSYGGHDFGWIIGYDECWFVQENGPRSKPGLTIGRTYTSVVKVRRDSVSAYLDGELVSRTGYSDLRPVDSELGIPQGTLALLTIDTPTVFHSIKVIPFGGTTLDKSNMSPERTTGAQQTVIGEWRHSVNPGSTFIVRLLPDGKIGNTNSNDTWHLAGNILTLRWPKDGVPGGAWEDVVELSRDGNHYEGKNQEGAQIAGVRISNATDTLPFDLTGIWKCDDGGTYRLTQSGTHVSWTGTSADGGRTWTNTFDCQIRATGANEFELIGSWRNVPPSQLIGNGELTLSATANRLHRTAGKNFGGTLWTRAASIGSPKEIIHSQNPDEYATNRKAAETVLSLGGTVTLEVNGVTTEFNYRDTLPTVPFIIETIDFMDDQRLANDDLVLLRGLNTLTNLNLAGTKITDAGLYQLANLQALEKLWLGGDAITDEGLRTLGNLKNLRFLGLFATQVTDHGMHYLSQLGLLEKINLGETQVSDFAVKSVLPNCSIWRPN